MHPLNRLAANRVCSQYSYRCRSWRNLSTGMTKVIIATVACFAFAATTISAFSSRCAVPLLSQWRYKEQQKKLWVEETGQNSHDCGRRYGIPLQVVVSNDNKQDNDDESTATVEFNNVLSRRQTLSALFVSSATLACAPLVAAAIEDRSNDSRALEASHSLATTNTIVSNGISSSSSSSSSGIFSASEPSSFQESISGFVAGGSLAAVKTLVKFPLDTATVRVQMPNSEYSIRDPLTLFDGCFNGISLTLLSNIPAGAVFFGVKDAVKTALKNSDGGSAMPRWMTTSLAVTAAMIPYWIVRNPSEVIKVRQQANVEGYGEGVSAVDAIRQTLQGNGDADDENENENNISDFYTGYWENIFYSLPADIIKFIAYEAITEGRKNLSPVEGARAGALATAMSQVVTTPLDVVRNRLMTGKDRDGSPLSNDEKKKGYVESLVDLGKEEGLSGLFAGVTPKVGKAILSGAIQFATYEETKQSMSKALLTR